MESPAWRDNVEDAVEITAFRQFHTSKGAIRFPVDKPLPAALVKQLVKARIAEKESRLKSRLRPRLTAPRY